jgi:hypothetical protein
VCTQWSEVTITKAGRLERDTFNSKLINMYMQLLCPVLNSTAFSDLSATCKFSFSLYYSTIKSRYFNCVLFPLEMITYMYMSFLFTKTYLVCSHVDGVRLYLWTAATNGPAVHLSHDAWVKRIMVEWYRQGKPIELREKPVPVSLYPPQIPHGLTRVSTVRGRRLTTWTMAWLQNLPYC